MSEFLSQGGYGFYIWMSYGISAVTLLLLTAWIVSGYRDVQARLKALQEKDGES
jgi:heme exporter protein D